MKCRVKCSLVALVTVLCAQPALARQVDVERYVREHQAAIVRELMDLLVIPNVRTDLPNTSAMPNNSGRCSIAVA